MTDELRAATAFAVGVKAETLTIPASQVRVGDVCGSELITSVKPDGRCVAIEFDPPCNVYRFPIGMMLTVSRPLPDPCPRGRMCHDTDSLHMGGFYLRNIHDRAAIFRRVCALWNEAEAATPYRTTDEIEAASG